MTPASANKLLGLELLRFVAAFGVLIWHYVHFAYAGDHAVGLTRDQLPFYRLLYPLYDGGVYGVWVFWCISGFIFFWKYRQPIGDGLIGGRQFFVLRLSRLYPLHLATLLLVALLQGVYLHLNGIFFVYQANDLRHFLLQLALASQWGLQRGDSFDGPIWSISVEVLVYLCFFLTLRLVSRSALINVVIVIACVNAHLIHARGMLFDCLAFFYVGGLAAMARRAIDAVSWRGAADAIAWLGVGALAGLEWHYARGPHDLFPYGFLLSWTPILLFCLAREIGIGGSLQRAIEAAGNMTYSSYLLHFPIQLAIAIGFSVAATPIPYYDATFFVAFVAITGLASYFAYRYFEDPAQAIIRRRLLRQPAEATAAATVAA